MCCVNSKDPYPGMKMKCVRDVFWVTASKSQILFTLPSVTNRQISNRTPSVLGVHLLIYPALFFPETFWNFMNSLDTIQLPLLIPASSDFHYLRSQCCYPFSATLTPELALFIQFWYMVYWKWICVKTRGRYGKPS